MTTTTAVAIIVAGGRGARFGGATPKQFHVVAGRPLLAHTVASFVACRAIERAILVLPREAFDEASDVMTPHLGAAVELAPGGGSRQASVRAGLERVAEAPPDELVVVHDGARPLATPGLIDRVVVAAAKHGAAIAAVPVVETLKRISEAGFVVETVDRERHFRAQTPQCFSLGLLRRAFERAERDGFVGTDESALVERLGAPVAVVAGDEENLKVTHLDDVRRVEYHLSMRRG